MSKYILPKEIEKDLSLSKWTVYDDTGVVLAQYQREPTKQDRPIQRAVDGSLLASPVYYGKWSPISPAALGTLNDKLKQQKKIKLESTETVYERRLRLLKEQLQKKIEEEQKEREDK